MDAPAPQASFELPPGGPDWLQAMRRDGLARFLATGFPKTTEEAWRTTDLSAVAQTRFGRPLGTAAPQQVDRALSRAAILGLEGARLVFVDGRFDPGRSSASPLPPGAFVGALSEALSRRPELVRPLLEASRDRHPFAALNAAMVDDGAVILLPPGALLEQPIHLIHLAVQGGPVGLYPRVVIAAGEDSSARVIESYLGTAAGYLSNAVTEIVLERGASVEHLSLQRQHAGAYHFAQVNVRQAGGSRFGSFVLSQGGKLSRTEVSVLLGGEGAECRLDGLFLGRDGQLADCRTFVDHAAPRCSSREVYKGILAGRSRGVFNGHVLVRPGAQKTDAQQSNKNLLLTRDALVNARPQLEIRADDVKCSHGSATGQLDDEAVFYLRSRGIGEEPARAMLTRAFAADVIERIPLAPVREALDRVLGEHLAGATPGASA